MMPNIVSTERRRLRISACQLCKISSLKNTQTVKLASLRLSIENWCESRAGYGIEVGLELNLVVVLYETNNMHFPAHVLGAFVRSDHDPSRHDPSRCFEHISEFAKG